MLKGQAVLVVGASRGIGAAIAERCAREGADLLVAARSLDKLQEVGGLLNFCRNADRLAGALPNLLLPPALPRWRSAAVPPAPPPATRCAAMWLTALPSTSWLRRCTRGTLEGWMPS